MFRRFFSTFATDQITCKKISVCHIKRATNSAVIHYLIFIGLSFVHFIRIHMVYSSIIMVECFITFIWNIKSASSKPGQKQDKNKNAHPNKREGITMECDGFHILPHKMRKRISGENTLKSLDCAECSPKLCDRVRKKMESEWVSNAKPIPKTTNGRST